MGELVFVCPWPVWVSLARRSEEAEPDEGSQGEERVPALPLPSWGMGDLPLAFFAQMWTLRPGLTCLFKVAEPRFELGAPVPVVFVRMVYLVLILTTVQAAYSVSFLDFVIYQRTTTGLIYLQ